MSPRRGKLATAVALAILMIAIPVRAEIGTVTGPDGPSTPVHLAYPPDDPDPVPWVRLSPPDPHKKILNEQGGANGDGPPSFAVQGTWGRPLVAWARRSAAGFDVVVSRFEGGDWTVPEVVAGTSADELDPVVITAGDGTVHLLYWVDDASPRVLHVQAPPDLSSWSAPELVSMPGAAACRPQGVIHEGVLQVAYEVHDFGFGSTPRKVVLARQEEGGFVPEIVAVSSYAGALRPEVHSHNGRLWLDWIDAQDEVAWTRRDAQGHWSALCYERFSSAMEREFFVRGTVRFQAAFGP